jgi:hypothetical protein
MTDATIRSFPALWTVVEPHEAFRIEDANGFPVAYVYFAADRERQTVMGACPRTRRGASRSASPPSRTYAPSCATTTSASEMSQTWA